MKYNFYKMTAMVLILIFAFSTATAINAAIDNNRTYIPSITEDNVVHASSINSYDSYTEFENSNNSVIVASTVKTEDYIEYYSNIEKVEEVEEVTEPVKECEPNFHNFGKLFSSHIDFYK